MFCFLKNHICPIGVDMGDDSLRLVQLRNNGKGVRLIAGGGENYPADVEFGSSSWQRWAIETLKKLTSSDRFRGKEVIAAMPASEVFIDHIKMPKIKDGVPDMKNGAWCPDDKLQEVLLSRIKQKPPFELDGAMIKYIPAEDDNVLIMAVERGKIDRHLAIYEKAQLVIKSLGIWPVALVNSYTRFFGRRQSDIAAIVMLLDIEANSTNIVICRHKTLLFARSIPLGVKQLDTDEVVERLVLELTGCRRQFSSMQRDAQIERLIFLSGQARDRNICSTIAKQLEIPAQVGDCLAAVEIEKPYRSGIDRRGCQVNWATAFGLSLS